MIASTSCLVPGLTQWPTTSVVAAQATVLFDQFLHHCDKIEARAIFRSPPYLTWSTTPCFPGLALIVTRMFLNSWQLEFQQHRTPISSHIVSSSANLNHFVPDSSLLKQVPGVISAYCFIGCEGVNIIQCPRFLGSPHWIAATAT